MKRPDCDCFKDPKKAMDHRAYMLGAAIASSAETSCALNGICQDALPYVFSTAIVMMLRCMAAYRAGATEDNPDVKCDQQFDQILATLKGDIIMRDEQLTAYAERLKMGGLQS